MIKRFKFYVLILLAFMASIWLASYLDGRKLSLPGMLNGAIAFFEDTQAEVISVFIPEPSPDLSSEPQPSEQSALTPLKSRQAGDQGELGHSEYFSFSGCKDLALGKAEPKPVVGIYSWTDEKGITHFSDVKPNDQVAKRHEVAGERVFDYFNLDLRGDDVPADFTNQLNTRIKKLFSFYGRILAKDSLKKTAVNLRFFKTRAGYDRFRKTISPGLTANTNGFYTDRNHEAAVVFTTPDSAMNTALHETSHIINRSNIGYSHRWLDEGLSEYLETIESEFQLSQIFPNAAWYHRDQFQLKLLPLQRLFTATDKEWNGSLRYRLYATSWAFIYFLMDTPQGKDKLTRLVNDEQQDLCNRLSLDQIKQALETDISRLQKNFTAWYRAGKLRTHRL